MKIYINSSSLPVGDIIVIISPDSNGYRYEIFIIIPQNDKLITAILNVSRVKEIISPKEQNQYALGVAVSKILDYFSENQTVFNIERPLSYLIDMAEVQENQKYKIYRYFMPISDRFNNGLLKDIQSKSKIEEIKTFVELILNLTELVKIE
jgi:hypothetical protein